MRRFPSQRQPTITRPKLGELAPQFEAESNYGKIRLEDYEGSWVILLSHPGDFCPTWTHEIKKFTDCFCELRKLECELLGIGSQNTPSPLMWSQNVQDQFGVKIWFPVISDPERELARSYGMVSLKDDNEGVERSIHVIDDKQILRAIVYYSPTNPETMGEIVRLVKLLRTTNASGIVTPDSWRPGDEWILTSPPEQETLHQAQTGGGEEEQELWYF